MNSVDLIWQPAIVIEHNHQHWLEFPSISTCARCRAGTGCGAGVFALFFAGRKPRLAMPASQHWQAGDALQVGVSARQLMRASLALYLFPLLCFMLGLTGCTVLVGPDQEGWSLITGIVCAAVGLIIIRSRALRVQSLRIEPLNKSSQRGPCDPQSIA